MFDSELRRKLKKPLLIKTRWQYHAASIFGSLALIAIVVWCSVLVFDDNGIDLLPLAIGGVALFGLLQAAIAIFSAMKHVEVDAKGLIISYRFTKHKNVINFSDVAEMKSDKPKKGSAIFFASITDSFSLVLNDGRVFSFSRSQFDQYGKLKEVCKKNVK